MIEWIKAKFKHPSVPSPDAAERENIGNLAIHHLDHLLARIENLAKVGRVNEAKAKAEATGEFLNGLQAMPNLPDNNRIDRKLDDPAFEYIEKLYNLLSDLLRDDRVIEAKALSVYFDGIKSRFNLFSERLERTFKTNKSARARKSKRKR